MDLVDKYLDEDIQEAKLSARGRTELARLEKEDNRDDGDVDWRRKTLAFMSDGRILQKYDVRFTATQYSKARKHSYGWTEYLKLKKGRIPHESYPNLIKSLESKGWIVKKKLMGSY